MSSIEFSPLTSPIGSPWSSPDHSCGSSNGSPISPNQASPGLSDAFGGLGVLDMNVLNEDMPARRKLQFNTDDTSDSVLVVRPKSPQEMLESTRNKIRRLESPLMPRKGSTAVGVYPITSPSKTNPHAVFKPGKMNSTKAILCRKVAEILDLDACVPPTIKARAAFLISQDDLDESLNPIIYKKAYKEGAPWLVNLEMACPVISLHKKVVSLGKGCDFTLEKEDGVITLEPKTAKAEDHKLAYEEVLILSVDGRDHIVQAEAAHPITCGVLSSYVKRGNDRFELKMSQDADDIYSDEEKDSCGTETRSDSFTESKDTIEIPDNVLLMRSNVTGLLQPMIQNVVTEIDGMALNMVSPSERRDKFFSMINTCSFINSVVLAILFRTQDGKAGCLDDTNFLFTQEQERLNLTLIDLDETWPVGNGLTKDPELRSKGEVAALRLGLMAYPQAHQYLQDNDKAHLGALLQRINQRRDALLSRLNKCKLPESEKVTAAFVEVLDRLNQFYKEKEASPVSLADLVFYVFPEYQKQWNELAAMGVPREKIASFIGFASVAEVKQMGRGAL